MCPRLDPSKPSRQYLWLSAILLIVVICYFPSLQNQFVNWDDDGHILENLTVRNLSLNGIKDIFTSTVNKTYIPLTTLSFAFEYHFFKLHPFIYHLNNLILHLAITLCVWTLARMMGLSVLAASLATLLFGIHPMHVESVAWVTERKDVLYGFFYMLALINYWRYLETSKAKHYSLTILFGILSILAKPMALSLPLVMFVLDWLKGREFSWRMVWEKIPHFAYIVPIAWITYHLNARLLVQTWVYAPLVWPWTFVFYLWKFLFPELLLPLYRLSYPVSFFNPQYFLSIIVFLGILGGVGYCLVNKRPHFLRKWYVFAVLFYFFSIFFLLRFDDLVDASIVSDRFIYLPGIGLCFLFGVLAERFLGRFQRSHLQKGAMVLLAGVLLLLGMKTYDQCRIWKNGIVLWKHQLKYYPDTAIALNNLATAYSKEKRYAEVLAQYLNYAKHSSATSADDLLNDERFSYLKVIIDLYNEAINFKTSYAESHYNLGNVYLDLKIPEKAVAYYHKTREIDPENKELYFNLGRAYAEWGRQEKAIEAFDKLLTLSPKEDVYFQIAKLYTQILREQKDQDTQSYQKAFDRTFAQYQRMVALKPRNEDGYINIGWILSEIGDKEGAIKNFNKVLEIDPRDTDTLYNLANTYRELEKNTEAIEYYQKVIAINPRFENAYLNLGYLYFTLKEYPLAIEAYQKAISVNPRFGQAYFNLAVAFEKSDELSKAIDGYLKVTDLEPAYVDAYYNLGNCYARQLENKKAIQAYLKVQEINPLHADSAANLSVVYAQEKQYKEALHWATVAENLGIKPTEKFIQDLKDRLPK